jgi:SAM-dependent methyltransferase
MAGRDIRLLAWRSAVPLASEHDIDPGQDELELGCGQLAHSFREDKGGTREAHEDGRVVRDNRLMKGPDDPGASGLASGYDRWASSDAYERYIGRWSRPVADQFVAWLEVRPGRRWLDVGCGTGALTQAILKRSAPVAVVGVDPVEPFIARASAELTDPRASFSLGSAVDTGLPDGAADVVVAGFVLNFVPDVGAALAEWRRVLAPSGVVGTYVWDYVRGMGFIRHFWDAAVAVDPAAAALDQGQQAGITAAGHLEAAFRAAGFVAVEGRSIAIPTVFADFDDLWLPFLGGTGEAPGYVATLDDVHRDAIREQLRRSIAPQPDGSIHFEARAWAVRARQPS